MKDAKTSIDAICGEYLLEEPNPHLRMQIQRLLSLGEASVDELADRMSHHLRFGTAGLRGRMEAGYNRINLVSVYRFCYAVGHEVITKADAHHRRIVIGFDARDNSQLFAEDAARILIALGADVHLFALCVPTPICAYAVKYLNALAGIMITASHNPKCDNGIKLYNSDSAQAHGELLSLLEQKMAHAPLRCDFFSKHRELLERSHATIIQDEVMASYLADIKQTRMFASDDVDRNVPIVYTPLHGVGKKFFLAAANEEGFSRVMVVDAQSEPNGQFPSVLFPNPEEEHTLDLAHDCARLHHIDWVFANDPDADRVQVSCTDNGNDFRKLSGNEMGAILGYFAIELANRQRLKPMTATSIVSSRMLRAISNGLGAHYVEGLTGFANIVATAMKEEKTSDTQLVFAYEEAIGFLVGQVVLDKDGINAAMRLMEIAGYLSKKRMTIWQLLDELYQRFGIFVNEQWSVRFAGVTAMDAMAHSMDRVRQWSAHELSNLFGPSPCMKFDLLERQTNGPYKDLCADVIILEINPMVRFIVRPSGTEPKIKCYLELFEKAASPPYFTKQQIMLKQSLKDLRNKIELLLKC